MAFRTFATIDRRTLAVSGHQHGGWQFVETGTPGARPVDFAFSIGDDGAGNFLLVCASLDGSLHADTWHETLDEAMALAAAFGIARSTWTLVTG